MFINRLRSIVYSAYVRRSVRIDVAINAPILLKTDQATAATAEMSAVRIVEFADMLRVAPGMGRCSVRG